MKDIFQKSFLKLLKEDIDARDPVVEPTEDVENQAFVDSLDDDTDPSEYDINPGSFKEISKENVETAKKWIKILEDFAELINGLNNPNSLNHFLNDVDREGSAFRGIVRSQGKRVTRMAEESAAMAEVLASNVVGSDRKQRELLQQFPNLIKGPDSPQAPE